MPQFFRLEFCRLADWALLQNCRYKKAYGTRCSQAVPHPSTIPARRCLTSVIRREPVYSSWYGRRQQFVKRWSIYRQMRRADLCKPGIVLLILLTKHINEWHLRNFHPVTKNLKLKIFFFFIFIFLQESSLKIYHL